jgi:stage V sporulation protein R
VNLARSRQSSLPPDLAAQARRIERIARGYGLDFDTLVFELLDASDVNGIAAYGGFPVRYPSWRFGMEFERLDKGYLWGLSKIYELVINNDPVVAYLVRSNSALEQKLVMAHVCGHADFFKHNVWFASTDRHMLDTMAGHATRIRRHIDRRGLDAVERFLDLALSLENLVDPYQPLREHLRRDSTGTTTSKVTETPTYDVLGFLVARAPIDEWQRDVLEIVRAEAYYFQPQRMTRIMNEGWASFWHSRMLTGGILDASEIVEFADCHSSATALAPGRMNPYKLGIELYRYAETRGEDIFRLRRVHNDASFLDELIDQGFVESQAMFLYGKNARSGRTEVLDRDWKKIKARLLVDLAWGGLPQIELVGIEDGREMQLLHHHDGRDLELAKAQATLKRLEELWKGPVTLRTLEDSHAKRLRCSGGEVAVEDAGPAEAKSPSG